MRSIAARMFDACGSSRNFASQLVDPDCAAGTPTEIVKVAIAISAPERRFMAAPVRSILQRRSANLIQRGAAQLSVRPLKATIDERSDMEDAKQIDTPDLAQGVAADSVADGAMVLGHVGEDEVLVTRAGGEWFAVGARCTHYRGPLAEGLIVGDTVRCPLHHACFSLRTGEALRAPALDPIACWRVERQGDHRVRAGEAARRRNNRRRSPRSPSRLPRPS